MTVVVAKASTVAIDESRSLMLSSRGRLEIYYAGSKSGGSSALFRLSTHCRSHDPIRDANVPEDRSCSLLEGTGQVWQLCQICYDVTFEAKTACGGGKIAVAKSCSAFLDTVGPQFVDLRPICPVIVDDDEHLDP